MRPIIETNEVSFKAIKNKKRSKLFFLHAQIGRSSKKDLGETFFSSTLN